MRTYSPKTINTIDPCIILGYISSTCIKRIQVDPRSALSIILKRLLYFLKILLNRLSAMITTKYGFNAGSSHPLEKFDFAVELGT